MNTDDIIRAMCDVPATYTDIDEAKRLINERPWSCHWLAVTVLTMILRGEY